MSNLDRFYMATAKISVGLAITLSVLAVISACSDSNPFYLDEASVLVCDESRLIFAESQRWTDGKCTVNRVFALDARSGEYIYMPGKWAAGCSELRIYSLASRTPECEQGIRGYIEAHREMVTRARDTGYGRMPERVSPSPAEPDAPKPAKPTKAEGINIEVNKPSHTIIVN